MTELMAAAPPRATRSDPAAAPDPAAPPGETPASDRPPGERFADALLTAGHGPPGRDAKTTDTRTADAEGAKAESDSPGPHDGDEPAAVVAASDVAVALAASLVVVPVAPRAAIATSVPEGQAPTTRGDGAPAHVVVSQAAVPVGPPAPPPAPADAPSADRPLARDPRAAATGPAPEPAAPPAREAQPPVTAPAAPEVRLDTHAPDPPAPGAKLAATPPAAAAPAPVAPLADTPAADTPVAGAPAAKVPPPGPALPDDAQAAPAASVLPAVTQRVETAAPAAPAPPPQPPAPPRPPAAPVPLSELAHAAGVAIRFTAGQDGGTARILLHPQELGSVEIRLRTTPEGILATVRADNPQAAQTLALASDDLRRSLEAQGLPVLNLDVSDGSRRHAAQENPEAPARRRLDAEAGLEEDEPVTAGAVHQPGSGSQIDVLA